MLFDMDNAQCGMCVQVLLSSLRTLLNMLQPRSPSRAPTPDSASVPSPAQMPAQACVFTVQVVLPKAGPVKMVPAPGEHKVIACCPNRAIKQD